MSLPTSPLVAVAWLLSLPELLAGAGTTLPADASTWAAHGYVVCQPVGDQGNIYVPMRHPIVSMDVWTVALDSGQAPVHQARQIAERIRAATFRDDRFPVTVTPAPGDYDPALIRTAYPLQGEPRLIPDPDGSRAHVQIDVAIMWTTKE